MRSLSFWLAATLAIGWLSTAAQFGLAQPHLHHRGVPRFRVGIQLFNPQGVRVTEHQDHYRYVVPSGGRYGSFYTYEDARYYTPPVVRVVGQQPQPAPRPVPLKFGSFQNHEQLIERLEMLANQFCLELHHNYQDNPDYDEAYREAYGLLQAVKQIHGKDHAGDHAAVQRSVAGIEEQFHHVEGDVREWRSANRRQVGQLNLAGKIEEMEAVIHHLAFDVGVQLAHADDDDNDAPRPREEAPPPRR